MGCLPVLVSGLLDAKSEKVFVIRMFAYKQREIKGKGQNAISLNFWKNM